MILEKNSLNDKSLEMNGVFSQKKNCEQVFTVEFC